MKIGIESNILRKLFANVYFINGTAYAGKSTMVRLLAERYDGIECGENYHNRLMGLIDPAHQPSLGYFSTMSGWQEFISRTPEQYNAWIQGCSREASELEIIELIRLSAQGRRIFVDTNIAVDVLREISDYGHVALMLCDPGMSVERFFERDDADKRFIHERICEAKDPEAAMQNYRDCIARINSPENYAGFAESGFFTLVRDGSRGIPETLAALAEHFGLDGDGQTASLCGFGHVPSPRLAFIQHVRYNMLSPDALSAGKRI